MKSIHWSTILLAMGLLVSASAVTACGTNSSPDNTGETGLKVDFAMEDIADVADVTSIRYIIDTCRGETVFIGDNDIMATAPPDHMADLVPASGFADQFLMLDAGCYNVEIQPLNSAGGLSDTCSPATATDIIVDEGRTTELALTSHCDTPDIGAIDVIGGVNHVPKLEALQFEKFTEQCRENVICGVVDDQDGDDIEFEWTQLTGPTLAAAPTVVNQARLSDNRVVECVSVVPAEQGTHTMQVRAFDVDGSGHRMEDRADVHSRTELVFPLHISEDPQIDECAQFDSQREIYVANLTPLNPDLGFALATGIAMLIVDGDDFSIATNSKGLQPGMIHPQHIHGFIPEADVAVCPSLDLDPNNDGVLDVIEGLPAYGDIQVHLDGDLPNLEAPGPFPEAFGPKGILRYKATTTVTELLQALGVDRLQLANQTVVQHGIDLDTALPDTVQSVFGLPPQLTLPLNCGTIERVDRFGPRSSR